MVKAKTITLNKINVAIKFNRLALNADYTEEKVGTKTKKRTIRLPYLQDGLINIPAQKWAIGWLKSLFGKTKDTRTTSVLLPNGQLTWTIGRASEILRGVSVDTWAPPESAAPYELDAELEEVALFPIHEWVVNTMGRSVTKLYYMIDGADSRTVPLEVVTTLPAKSIEDAFKRMGGSLGMGPRAACVRHGTFVVEGFSVISLGEVSY